MPELESLSEIEPDTLAMPEDYTEICHGCGKCVYKTELEYQLRICEEEK